MHIITIVSAIKDDKIGDKMSIIELSNPEDKTYKTKLQTYKQWAADSENFKVEPQNYGMGAGMAEDKDMEELEEFLGPNSEIGNQLRSYYSGVQSEPIPDKFLNLLAKLELAEASFAQAEKITTSQEAEAIADDQTEEKLITNIEHK